MTQKKKSADRPEGLSASLEESLIESLPGLVVLDRDLDYGGQVGIDLVAADQAGALTLVLLVDGEGEEPVLAALDVLAFARREQLLLERHLGQASFRGDLPPRVILVADRFDQLLRERIAPLGDVRVELFELRELKSAAATRSYLVPRGDGAIEGAGDQSLAAFLDSLSEERRPLAALALRRIGRIDTELTVRSSEDAVSWFLGEELLCTLERGPEGLSAQTAAGQPGPLGDEGDLDRFLEQVLGGYVASLEEDGVTGDIAGEESGDRPAGEGAGDGWQDLDEMNLEPGGALLTPEEIEAFRE